MSVLHKLSALLKDPPPAYAFEVSETGIAMANLSRLPDIEFKPLAPGSISVSPLHDNIVAPEELATAVRAVAQPNGNRKRWDAALILPDYCARLSVLDFDAFPSDAKEQLSLVRFRMKKSVPFDIEAAAISYWPQPIEGLGKKVDVLVAVTPQEIVSRYEAPFRAAQFNPGFVTMSSLAALQLIEGHAVTVLAKLSGRVLTVIVIERGHVRLIRCLELPQSTLSDIAADLYPTFVYIEDNLAAKAERLLLCGFGTFTDEARRLFQAELNLEVEPLRSRLGMPQEANAGLMGYLQAASENLL